MKRCYETLIGESLAAHRQMVLLSGPRQVGKTTCARQALPQAHYFNYDNITDARTVSSGPNAVAAALDLANPNQARGGVIFDELHKFSKWKNFLKGFFDVYGEGIKIAVTGSARLDVYKRGGDSLMGRYFPYRIHPLSPAELASGEVDLNRLFQSPKKVSQSDIETLLQLGGFPEPFLDGTARFHNRWRKLRLEQIFTEDLRDLSRVQDIRQLQALAEILRHCVGSGLNYSSLACDLCVTSDTIKAWITTLESVFWCWTIRPYFRNVTSSIRKQPKIYLWDWSELEDGGARCENFLAGQLLKAVNWWTESGLGDFELCYLRDKMQREVDFVVVKDGAPFMLVECKRSGHAELCPHLQHFQKELKADYAFQVAFDLPLSELNPIDYKTPIKVSAADFLKILI